MRKVECLRITYEYKGGERLTIKSTVEGLFHQWGSEFEEFENGPGNYTVAIVELDDGVIETFQPRFVKFITAA